MRNAVVLVEGLAFPEGPTLLPNGDLLVVEIQGGRLTRVTSGGTKSTVAELGGGPNGAAIGPDGAVYVCNNGGGEQGSEVGYSGGRIQRVDLATGAFESIYTECAGHALVAPNDLVFDEAGGFWFSDLGRRFGRMERPGGVYYAQPDGSSIEEISFPLNANGVGLSPDRRTLYVAETVAGRLWSWPVVRPGCLGGERNLVVGLPGYQLFDSLAVEENGNVCVATLINGGITVVTPEGKAEHVPVEGDPYVTNICFGGEDLRTAYITLSKTGRVLVCQWPRPGLRLAW